MKYSRLLFNSKKPTDTQYDETLETSALKLFTMANLRYQLSW